MKKSVNLSPENSGIYRSPPDLTSARECAAAHHISWFEIDLAGRTKRELLESFARALAFPSAFGHNWDALADMLQDMSWHAAQGYVLHLRHALGASHPEDWTTLLEVLRGSTMYWKARGKTFIVFVDEVQQLQPWM